MLTTRRSQSSISCVAFALLVVLACHVSSFTTHQYRHHIPTISSSNAQFSSSTSAAPIRTLPVLSMISDDEEEEDDEDDDEDPLANGIDSVSWLDPIDQLPTIDTTSSSPLSTNTSEIIPLFPLGGIVYTPNSEHILNIFEPRYRQMYSDILMNGSKRFAVAMSHPHETGRFAAMGVLFELKDLKEVSEQTGDQIKFICSHKVTGRVQMHRILNPQVWKSRETYLRVEATILDDSDTAGGVEEEAPTEQKMLRNTFSDMVEIQHQLAEDVRFTRSSVLTVATKPGAGEDGLWQTIKLWQSFADQRLTARQNELQRDFQEKLQDFLKREKGLAQDEMPSAVGFQDLPPNLQQEVLELQKSMAIELQPLVLESQLTMQKVLECPDHLSRLKLVRTFMEAETKRLRTKKTLQSMFAADPMAAKATPEPIAEESPQEESSSSSSSSFFGDDDAFQ